MRVDLEKAPMPIVWLDTCFLIEMAIVRARDPLGEVEADRGIALYDSLHQLANAGRVLCPAADQREEYEQARGLVPVIQDVQADLSLGTTFLHRRDIEDHQICIGLRIRAKCACDEVVLRRSPTQQSP